MSPASSFGDRRKNCRRANCSLICFPGRIAAAICQIASRANLFCLAKNGKVGKKDWKGVVHECLLFYIFRVTELKYKCTNSTINFVCYRTDAPTNTIHFPPKPSILYITIHFHPFHPLLSITLHFHPFPHITIDFYPFSSMFTRYHSPS